jgi:hypothetical protein
MFQEGKKVNCWYIDKLMFSIVDTGYGNLEMLQDVIEQTSMLSRIKVFL